MLDVFLIPRLFSMSAVDRLENLFSLPAVGKLLLLACFEEWRKEMSLMCVYVPVNGNDRLANVLNKCPFFLH